MEKVGLKIIRAAIKQRLGRYHGIGQTLVIAIIRVLLLAVVWPSVCMALSMAEVAAEKPLGAFKDWSAVSYQGDDGKVCVAWSVPKSQTGNYTRRGAPYVFINLHKKTPGRIRIRFTPGYSYKADSRLMVTIKAYSISLKTDSEVAWTEDEHQTSRLIKVMRDGAEMVVEGTSSRGTKTLDVYSLHGLSAAYKAISKACG